MQGKNIFVLVLVCGFSLATSFNHAQAHGGGLNSAGCHNNHSNGTYHCHRGSYDGDDDDLEAALIVTGVIVVVWWIVERNHTGTDLVEEPRIDGPALAPYYDIEEDEFGLRLTVPF